MENSIPTCFSIIQPSKGMHNYIAQVEYELLTNNAVRASLSLHWDHTLHRGHVTEALVARMTLWRAGER